MRTISPRFRTVAVAVASLVLAGTALAAETIQYAVPSGLKFSFDNTMRLDLSISMDLMGQQMKFDQKMSQIMKGSAEVLESANGRPTRVRMTFDDSCGGSTSGMGGEAPIPFSVGGQTVTVTVKGKTVTLEPSDAVDDVTRQAIADLVVLDDGFLPKKPVDVGDEWEGSFGSSANAAPGAEASRVTFRVEKFTEMAGRQVAVLSARGTMDETADGMNMKTDITGPVIVDLATGLVMKATVDGTVVMDGKAVQQGMEITMQGTGAMKVRNGVVFGASGSAGRVAAPAIRPAKSNPLGGEKEPASDLDGTWSGDGLTMVVKGSVATLTLGDLALDGTLTEQTSGNFKGTFKYGGETFTFEGDFEGDSASLVTGGATYALKRG
ncbi:MAG: hypothetical protein AB8G96_01105 [Phycisphaerales bacterium]